ncbi:unnamed protein product [Phytophthora lilii]|uniref:Unnamed protein product n=1 Tax=Phytophthora lilii TaxID=2077276 RepID=A0A9W6TMP5_9STRA|nr:unnamed protein product [Phytophthora lilii]
MQKHDVNDEELTSVPPKPKLKQNKQEPLLHFKRAENPSSMSNDEAEVSIHSDRSELNHSKPISKRCHSLNEQLIVRSSRIAISTTPSLTLSRASTALNSQVHPVHCRKLSDTESNNHSPSRNFSKSESFRLAFFHKNFYSVYGNLGPITLLAFTLSAITMAYEVVVQITPNWTANFLMGTDKLDDGEFLVISKPSDAVVVISAFMFALFACLYVYLIVFMLSYNDASTIKRLAQPRGTDSLLIRIALKFLSIFTAMRFHGKTVPREAKPTLAAVAALNQAKKLKIYAVKMQRISLFDMFFSVFAPVIMLVYAYNSFDMDRANFATREETLTPGSFDRIARVFADPIEMELLKSSFANLQITEGRYIFVKCFLNIMGVYKWRKLIKHLILANHSRTTGKDVDRKNIVHMHSRLHFTLGAFVFISCCLGIASYTVLAIVTSTQNCKPFDHCAVYSYRWRWGQDLSCPCIVFIDRELSPLTFDEWINSPDVTEAVQALAPNGYLQTVQIINRALPELPEELRLCKNLKDL